MHSLSRAADRAVALVGGFVGGVIPAPGAPKPNARREVVRTEIRALERQLAQLHARIASGVRGEAGHEPERWIRQARELRERLHERRLALARLDRVIAREARLSPELAVSKGPAREPPPKKTSEPARARRRAVMRALERCGPEDREVFRRLAEALLRAEPAARRSAVVRLAELGAPARPLLSVSLGDSDERVRLRALLGLLDTKRGASAEQLRSLAEDPSPLVRAAAIRGLVRTDRKLALSLAVEALEDRVAEVRRAAADALGRSAPTRALMPLAFALVDEDASVRAAAASALGALGDDRAVLPLIRTLSDPDAGVRDTAAESLRLLVGEAVEEAAENLAPEDLALGLTFWWRSARVDLALARRLRGVAGQPEREPPRPTRSTTTSALLDGVRAPDRGLPPRVEAQPVEPVPSPVTPTPVPRTEKTAIPAPSAASERTTKVAVPAGLVTTEPPVETKEKVSLPPRPLVEAEPPPPTAAAGAESDFLSTLDEGGDGEFESIGGGDDEEFESIGGDDEEFESIGGDDEEFESIGGDDEEFESIGGGDEEFESIGGGDEEGDEGEDEEEYETLL